MGNEYSATAFTIMNSMVSSSYRAVSRAVKAGEMIRPVVCSRCGKISASIEGHHARYDKPLSVQWVCHSCHKKIHLEIKKEFRKGKGDRGTAI